MDISFKPVFFISAYSSYTHLYLFLSLIYPNSRLYFSNPYSLSHSILCISTYICFYLLSIHFGLFIPLCLSRLMPISFYLFFNLNSRLYFSNPFSLSHSIDCITIYICFYILSMHLYFFISLCQSGLRLPLSIPVLPRI